MANDTLTITDNRTGKSYEVAIEDGAIRALDLRAIKTSEDDFGLLTYDPALTNTAACRSAVTLVDGAAGILRYRGYPIEQLAEDSTFLETAYLIIKGELPDQEHLDAWQHNITMHTMLHENLKKFIEGFRYDAHPMGILIGTVAALSTFYPDAREIDDIQSRRLQARRLIGKMPTIAAYGLPLQLRASLRTTRQSLELHGQLPVHAQQDDRDQLRARSGLRARAGRPFHPPRRPRTELFRLRHAHGRQLT